MSAPSDLREIRRDAMRAWTGLFRWPARATFRVGTAWVRDYGPAHEVEEALHAEFERLWGSVLPADIPRPDLVGYEPGMIVLQSDGGEG